VIFPGRDIADWIEEHEEMMNNYTEYSKWELLALKNINRPRTRLVLSPEAKELMKKMRRSEAWPSLKRCIQGEMSILRNTSSGDVLVLHVVDDCSDDSFYFYSSMVDESDGIFSGKTAWNGGWIKHRLYEHGETTDNYSYSSHH
jgi:hypothetical protein